MSKWGVYGVVAHMADGSRTSNNRVAKRFTVRWRVDGVEHERTFPQKGYADDFRDRLTVAKVQGWPADQYGWPVDPALLTAEGFTTLTAASVAPSPNGDGHTFESYVWDVWWPIVGNTRLATRAGSHTAAMPSSPCSSCGTAHAPAT